LHSEALDTRMNYLPTKHPSLGDPEMLAERGMHELRLSVQKPYMLVLNSQFREMAISLDVFDHNLRLQLEVFRSP